MTWLPDRGLELVIDVAFQDVPDGIRIVPVSAGWMLEVPAAVAAVVPAGHRTTSAPIRRQVDVMAVDEGDVATSLEAEVGLVDGAAASASDGSRIHIRAVLPVAEASPAGQHASGRLAFMVQLSLTGPRNRVPVTVRGRPTIEASHNRPNGEDAHAERRPVPSRAGGGRLVLDVGPDDLAKRLRRPLGHARRRVGQCVHLVRARVR
jgi:hypothetical protein